MEDRRNAHKITYALQTGAAEMLGFHAEQTGLGGRLSGTAGGNNDNVVGDQLLHDLNVGEVGTHLGVVAADDRDGAADDTCLDAVDEGFVCIADVYMAVCDAVEFLDDGFAGVADAGSLLVRRNTYFDGSRFVKPSIAILTSSRPFHGRSRMNSTYSESGSGLWVRS